MRCLTRCIGTVIILLMLISVMIYALGLRINISRSIPLGFYQITDKPIAKGDYVIFCPPQTPLFKEALARGYISSGFCSGSSGYLMKKVWAMGGDTVLFGNEGVYVNGSILPYSKPLASDSQGRVLPRLTGSIELKASELLLMTDQSPFSFDARYFGLIDKSQVSGVIKPLFTWPSKSYLKNHKGN